MILTVLLIGKVLNSFNGSKIDVTGSSNPENIDEVKNTVSSLTFSCLISIPEVIIQISFHK